MYVLWHGTASIEVVCPSGRILFDPFVPLKGSNVEVALEDYDGFTDIFVTHGHFDHISSIPDIVKRNPSAKIHCTRTPFETLARKGVPKDNLAMIFHGQILNANGFMISVLHGRHALLPRASFSRTAYMLKSPHRGNLPRIIWEHTLCRENNETVFYHIEAEGKSLSLMGSLNLREDEAYPQNADLLVLPYNGWKDNFPPSVRIIERLNPKRIVLTHYDDTFPPVTMPIDLSPLIRKYKGRVTAMELGKAEAV